MKKVVKMFAISMMVAMMSVVAVNAQSQGDMAVGGDLSIGMGDDYTNIGIGAKFRYNITDPIRLEGAFTYFVKKDHLSMWDFSAYGHYLFNVADGFTVYPLAGLGFFGSKVNVPKIEVPGVGTIGGGSASNTDFVFTFGGGLDYALTSNLSLNAEMKYKVVDYMDRFVISAGITYKF